MPKPSRIKFKGAVYELVRVADEKDPAFQPLLQDFQNETEKFSAAAKKTTLIADVENSSKAVMSKDYNMGYTHLGSAQEALSALTKQLGAVGEALNTLVGVAGIKTEQKAAASVKKR